MAVNFSTKPGGGVAVVDGLIRGKLTIDKEPDKDHVKVTITGSTGEEASVNIPSGDFRFLAGGLVEVAD